MSTTIAIIQQKLRIAPTTLQTRVSAPVFPRQDADPTDVPSMTADDPSALTLDTSSPTPTSVLRQTSLRSNSTSTTSTILISSITSTASITSATNSPVSCSTSNECGLNQACKNQICVSINDGSPMDGANWQPTSRMNAGTAVGVVIGVFVLIVLIVVAFVFLKLRARNRPKTKRPNTSPKAPSDNRDRSFSSATENDQKTLVGSLPNSPQNALFGRDQNEMAPALFAKALDVIEPGREKEEDARSISTMKALPPRPLPASPPRTPAKENYALNVNINKSMIFDEDMRRAVSPSIISECETPRKRTQRYQFEEVLPSSTTTPRLSTSQTAAASKRNSEYELKRYSKAETVSEAGVVEEEGTRQGGEPQSPTNASLPRYSMDDEAESRKSMDESIVRDGLYDDMGPQSPREEALAKLESKAPQIEAPLPSPSFSFRSYDWYQDIIGDSSRVGSPTTSLRSRSPAQTPVSATFPPSVSSASPRLSAITASLFPEPPTHVGNSPVSPSFLHPNSAMSSPTTANFKLSPTVYQMPSPRARPMPSPLLLDPLSARNSRSWLPDDGVYLPGEGPGDTFEMFTRSSSKPSIYSPLN